ncbi:MAG: hypothetical protein M3545_03380 [Acidobacteriota bacterium]|nr:hypothetical protein [Acidobacteriota bacterium]
MPLLHLHELLLLLLVTLSGQGAPGKPDCRTSEECRQQAVDAAARSDFETFHDVAWRAVQLGPRNDPALMYLLARAQSLSGRPHDAMVMLERLAALGFPLDAATNDDFRRVRALAKWPALAATLNGDTHLYGKSLIPEVSNTPTLLPEPRESPEPSIGRSAPAPDRTAAAARPATPSSTLAPLRFRTPLFTPAGLGYDAVSRRFVVGDRHGRKLAVVDEFSQAVANLAGARTSGFGEISALEIDPREGYLWVVSSEGAGASLHKLQLISGRLLWTYAVPDTLTPVHLADVAVAAGGAILALDTAGRRIFRVPPRATAATVALRLPDAPPTSLAPAPDGIVYVATADGLARADLAGGSVANVKAPEGVDITGLTRIRWHGGALAGIQKASEGEFRAVRIRLDRAGRRVTRLDVLDPSISISNPTAATVVGGVLYYLANGEAPEMVVRRVALQ